MILHHKITRIKLFIFTKLTVLLELKPGYDEVISFLYGRASPSVHKPAF